MKILIPKKFCALFKPHLKKKVALRNVTSGLFHNTNIKFEIFLQYLKDSYYVHGVLGFWGFGVLANIFY